MASVMRMHRSLRKSIFSAFFIGSLFSPNAVLAVQQHGGAEGLISHQIGHLLFITGMVVLFHRLKGTSSGGHGWVEFKCFIGTIILWNILTFYGHWHNELISPDKFIKVQGNITGMQISGPLDVIYYFSRLDHLLLVPAFLFLMTALSKWRGKS